jgi:hypothetical protein
MSAVVFGTEEKYKELQTASYAPDFTLSSLWTAYGHSVQYYPYRGKAAAILFVCLLQKGNESYLSWKDFMHSFISSHYEEWYRI